MATLSTHVLDLVAGVPARGVRLWLHGDGGQLFDGETNADGRCPELARIASLAAGRYRLEFAVAPYFQARGVVLDDPPFLEIVPICFGIAEGGRAHYHVPLLVSPYGFSTYRGS
ncbi:hypothetical protein AA103196_1660 [Ameyamaea chiangmaiensis NBRC 103196]|uniref:5-hydroxyisourate hydrolase n=1 Tax=Ameyamaea chiangmaiensis TaxID=442969 RepID=A0A850P964_9PROT|nr:hydroxyisourate hydrolase [Ameyamaea chiangmaiensis]MBS4074074.1 hydroxyisourate hydrolase [Ameyamaea chiangmaiensis]NVN40448.1 hydroxyisourate hydrolase [Ameyamaea chiangmaiensis]GBQ67344.1 hypothetical protein AA103196_1660 [Ameyamaea chiangmaiensis NBRC 103196]